MTNHQRYKLLLNNERRRDVERVKQNATVRSLCVKIQSRGAVRYSMTHDVFSI